MVNGRKWQYNIGRQQVTLMRLICPNCGAQYEVPDEVIPTNGRDVQCSNCGDTWFQHHPDHPPEESADSEPQEEQTWESPEAEPAEDTAGPESIAEPEPEAETASHEPERRQLDPSVTGVLREEAERERQARAIEQNSGLETQPDLGLDDQAGDDDERSRQARARMERLRGEPESTGAQETPDVDIDPGARSNLLPDVDEINSSLGSGAKAPEDAPASAGPDNSGHLPDQKGGFRRGFLMAIVIALILFLIYKYAPMVSERVPAMAGALSAYVEIVDQIRAALNALVSGFLK